MCSDKDDECRQYTLSLQVHMVNFLDNHRIEIQIPSTAHPDRKSLVTICRGTNRDMESLSPQDPERSLTSSDFLFENLSQNSTNLL